MVLGRRVPLITQLTGLTGQLGAVAAAVPMTYALSGLGWTTTYLAAAGLGVLLALALAVVVHDAPDRVVVAGPRCRCPTWPPPCAPPGPSRAPGSGCGSTSARSSRRPSSPCCGASRSWCRARDSRHHAAGALLTLLTVSAMVAGPLVGSSSPGCRSTARRWCSASSARSSPSGRRCSPGRATRRSGCWPCSSWSAAWAARPRWWPSTSPARSTRSSGSAGPPASSTRAGSSPA